MSECLARSGFHAWLVVVAGCGSGEPSGSARWTIERPGVRDPRASETRASAENVSRPLWDPRLAEVRLDPAPGARIELELAGVEAGPAPKEVTLLLARDGEARRIGARDLGPERPGSRPWYRYEVALDGVRAGAWKLALEIDGQALEGNPRWIAACPRIVQRKGSAGGPNVLYIAIDTLRADHLGCYGHDRPTSPHIDALAAGGARFERALSQAAWTLPSFASLFSGRDPESHGVVHVEYRFSDEFVSFVELFARAGYATGGVVSGTFTDSHWGFDQGFDSYDDLGMVVDDDSPEGPDPNDTAAMEMHAHKRVTSPDVTSRASQWLEDHQAERFFFFAHYFDPHQDYVLHPGVSERFPPRATAGSSEVRNVDRQHAAYEGEIAFTDQYVGELLAKLEALGLARETVIVLQADHGEAFAEHGLSGHGSSLYNEQLRIPLLIRVPELEPRTILEAVGVLDVGPTLLDLCGIPPQSAMQGCSLVPLLHGERWRRPLAVSASLYRSFEPARGGRGMQFHYRVEDGGASFLGDLRPKHRARWMFDWAGDLAQLEDLAPRELERSVEVEARYLDSCAALHAEREEPVAQELGAAAMRTLSGLGYAGDEEEQAEEAEAGDGGDRRR